MNRIIFFMLGGMGLLIFGSWAMVRAGEVFGANGFIVGTVGFVVLTLVVVLGGIRMIVKATKPKDIPNGIPATATVTACRQGSVSMKLGAQQLYQLVMDLVVTGSNGNTWPAQLREMVPLTQVGLFQPGTSFAVKFDPLHPERVVFDQAQAASQATVNIPGQGTVAASTIMAAKQAAPADITLRLQASSLLLNELKVSGVPADAEVINQQVYHENYLPGTDAVSIRYRYLPNGSGPLESEQLVLTPKTALHKSAVGCTIHVRYDRNNPRRVAMSGTDKQDSAVEV